MGLVTLCNFKHKSLQNHSLVLLPVQNYSLMLCLILNISSDGKSCSTVPGKTFRSFVTTAFVSNSMTLSYGKHLLEEPFLPLAVTIKELRIMITTVSAKELES